MSLNLFKLFGKVINLFLLALNLALAFRFKLTTTFVYLLGDTIRLFVNQAMHSLVITLEHVVQRINALVQLACQRLLEGAVLLLQLGGLLNEQTARLLDVDKSIFKS